MLLYPTLPHARLATIVRDVAVALLLVLFIYLGIKVHDTVDQLSVLGRGVTAAGTSVSSGFNDAAGAVGSVPLVGDSLKNGLESAGQNTGGSLAGVGRDGEQSAHHLANLLGALTAVIPALLLLWNFLPGRIAQAQRLTAARRVLLDPSDPERRELLARRAAFGLPYATLLQFTRDPLGDLHAGRLDGLVAAVLADAGLRVPASSAATS